MIDTAVAFSAASQSRARSTYRRTWLVLAAAAAAAAACMVAVLMLPAPAVGWAEVTAAVKRAEVDSGDLYKGRRQDSHVVAFAAASNLGVSC